MCPVNAQAYSVTFSSLTISPLSLLCMYPGTSVNIQRLVTGYTMAVRFPAGARTFFIITVTMSAMWPAQHFKNSWNNTSSPYAFSLRGAQLNTGALFPFILISKRNLAHGTMTCSASNKLWTSRWMQLNSTEHHVLQCRTNDVADVRILITGNDVDVNLNRVPKFEDLCGKILVLWKMSEFFLRQYFLYRKTTKSAVLNVYFSLPDSWR